MAMIVGKTCRGFSIATFQDHYDKPCSIQKSSLATEDCIWLGRSDGDGQRMHLTQAMVKELLPMLKSFVKTGEF